MDILIRNGRVIDPYNQIDRVCDIAVDEGIIVGIGSYESDQFEKVVEADGCIVTPGLIDFHAHVYPLTEIGIPAEATCFSSGITTIVDAGSSGAANFEHYRGFIASSKVRIKCDLNVCSAGLVTTQYHENIDPAYYDRKKIKQLFRKYPNELLGLKVRLSKPLTQEMGTKPLIETVKLAEEIGTRVIVHSTNSPVSMEELISHLRPGDVVTHAYHNYGNTIIGDDGKVFDAVKAGREKGVLFDVANARFHFAFKVARAALKDGFLPDIISTDLTVKSLYKKPQIFNMMFLLSKYLNMGLTLGQIIERCTVRPAEAMNMQGEIGCLSPGACADVAILKVLDREVHFEDWEGETLVGDKLLKTMTTIRDGQIVYRDIEV